MVHQNRTVSKAIAAKHVSPIRNTETSYKQAALGSSPADSFLHKKRLSAPPMQSSNSNRNAFHYNNMINNNREQFNALHFC